MCDTERGRSSVSRRGGQVLVEERDELGAELLDVGIEGQLHQKSLYSAAIIARCSAAPPSISSPALARFSAN